MHTELTACEPFEYDHKPVVTGQDFKATEMHARILVHAGRATYKTREMKATEVPATTPATGEPALMDEKPRRGGRRYARRDMQADET